MDVESSVVPNITRVVRASEARRKLQRGVDAAADAVGCTLGPRGRTVLIQRADGGAPVLTKDGVTVSRSINLRDPLERMGAQMLLEAATRTNDVAGDGTTTATVLAQALIAEGNRLLEAGYASRELREGMERAVGFVETALVAGALRLGDDSLVKIATVSANGDRALGALVSEAIASVGSDGAVAVEDAPGTSTFLEVLDGMRFPCGYVSSYFVTNSDRMVADYEGTRVLVTDEKIPSMREIVPLLEWCASSRTPLLIIAPDFEGDALQALILNRTKGSLPVVAVRTPREALAREELLQDVCAMTGARLVSSCTGRSLAMAVDCLGSVRRTVVGDRWTTLVGVNGANELLQDHVSELRARAADVTSPADVSRRIRERIGRLAAGAAVLRVGGATELEVTERRHRVEDALNATRAASEDGVLAGGGAALLRAALSLHVHVDAMPSAMQPGARAVIAACSAPVRRIASNAGASPDIVVERLTSTPNVVYDAVTRGYVDPSDAGILDPVRSTLTALRNAASVAAAFLSLDAVVCEDVV